MSTNRAQKRATLLMLVCASLWSIAGIFIKLIPWNALAIAGWRSLLAAGCMAVYLRATGRRFALSRDSLLCGVFLCLTFLCFVSANKLTTAANAIVLQFTAPVFILVLSAAVYRQRFSRADLLAVALTMAGISLFFFDRLTPGNLLGNLVAICAGFSMAWMYIATGRAGDDDRMSGILLGHLFTALIGVPVTFLTPSPLSPAVAASVLVLGVVQLGIPYVLFGIAERDCPPLACSLLGALEPLLNPVWVFLFSGERPGGFALAGGVIVIATITVWCVHRDRLLAAAGEG